jgi:hypothetical protein
MPPDYHPRERDRLAPGPSDRSSKPTPAFCPSQELVSRALIVENEPVAPPAPIEQTGVYEEGADWAIEDHPHGKYQHGMRTHLTNGSAALWGEQGFTWLLALRPAEWSQVFLSGDLPPT